MDPLDDLLRKIQAEEKQRPRKTQGQALRKYRRQRDRKKKIAAASRKKNK